jgi:hypothetical protein
MTSTSQPTGQPSCVLSRLKAEQNKGRIDINKKGKAHPGIVRESIEGSRGIALIFL